MLSLLYSMESSFPFIAALMASMLHVIMGPDHLAAVTPFAIETKRKAWKIGLSWGLGHLAGMLGIGVLFALFKELIPVDLISKYSEQLVGFVLLGIGGWALYKLFKKEKIHAHLHVHSEQGPVIHKHPHDHSHEQAIIITTQKNYIKRIWRPFPLDYCTAWQEFHISYCSYPF